MSTAKSLIQESLSIFY